MIPPGIPRGWILYWWFATDLCSNYSHGILIYGGDWVSTQKDQSHWKKNAFLTMSIERACHAIQGHMGKQQIWSWGRRNKEEIAAQTFLLCFLWERYSRAVLGNSIGLAGLSNVHGLLPIVVVYSCLVPGLGLI